MSFRELQKPHEETAGPSIGKWFVYAVFNHSVDTDVYALLADGSLSLAAVDIGDDGDPFYFDTELDVYRAGHDYYNKNGLLFPFMPRLLELETKYGIGKGIMPSVIESEVMEFQ